MGLDAYKKKRKKEKETSFQKAFFYENVTLVIFISFDLIFHQLACQREVTHISPTDVQPVGVPFGIAQSPLCRTYDFMVCDYYLFFPLMLTVAPGDLLATVARRL